MLLAAPPGCFLSLRISPVLIKWPVREKWPTLRKYFINSTPSEMSIKVGTNKTVLRVRNNYIDYVSKEIFTDISDREVKILECGFYSMGK